MESLFLYILVVLLKGISGQACMYGSDSTCVYPCNCADVTEVCDPISGFCPASGCKDGPPTGHGFTWTGPGCRIGNVAYGKPANQTGTLNHAIDFSAHKAVDGIVTPDIFKGSCAVMEAGVGNPGRWLVDLQKQHVIYNVALYNRASEEYAYRMADMSVYVSNSSDYFQHTDLCGFYPGQVPPAESITITCDPPRVARYVSVRNGDNIDGGHHLVLCEVVVIGYQAADCSGCAEGGCDSFTGCVACSAGKRKPDCKRDCITHCRYSCDSATALCEAGCEDWWILPSCTSHIPAPNMSHIIPQVSIQSPTSIRLDFLQLDIDDALSEFYDYVAEYKTQQSEYILVESSQQMHEVSKERNTLLVDGFIEDTQYTVRIRPFREIRETTWNNERRLPGIPCSEVHVKLPAGSSKVDVSPTDDGIDSTWESTTTTQGTGAAEQTSMPDGSMNVDAAKGSINEGPVVMIVGVSVSIAVVVIVIAAVGGFRCARRKYGQSVRYVNSHEMRSGEGHDRAYLRNHANVRIPFEAPAYDNATPRSYYDVFGHDENPVFDPAGHLPGTPRIPTVSPEYLDLGGPYDELVRDPTGNRM